jgi:acyl-homoserine lactone acylase PvdQ
MRGTRLWIAVGVMASAALSFAPAAFAQEPAPVNDPTIIARNILPSGQYGLPGPGASTQAQMYDALTPLFDNVQPNDLFTDFKSEKLGIDTDGPTTQEVVPFPGVTLLRDKFNIPHVYATTRDASIQTAGWIAAEDRGLLLQLARYDALLAAIDAPGLTAVGLISQGASFQPSAQTTATVSQQTNVLMRAGREGQAVLRDIDLFILGINAYLKASGSNNAPWTRNDVYAVNALKGQFLGQGGGDEVNRSAFLNGLEHTLGKKGGFAAFNDLRQYKNPRSVTSVDGNFPYGHIPKRHPGSVVIDNGSFKATPSAKTLSAKYDMGNINASNELMVSGRRSTTGHPILVGGPQISYFMPGFVYEIDMHAPSNTWRGATSAPFPGYLLIGRGTRFSSTLTSASADIIDEYAETLCGGSTEKYMYKGRCRQMGHFDAGTLNPGTANAKHVDFLTTVHGSVQGYATVHGRQVAISSKRSSYGRDVLDQLFFRRLSNGSVKSPKTFYKAAALTPQTFNSFYLDRKNFAEYTSGRLPIRPEGTDPGLLTKGTGKFEWRGFVKADDHPHGANNKKGFMTNWNNGVARGFGAADDEWGRNGSVGRVNLLTFNLKRLAGRGKWSPQTVTSAMNAAATQDVRAIVMVPLLARLLRGSTPPSTMAAQMLDLLNNWRQHGGNRLDLNNDGLIDYPGAAIMDAAYPNIVNNEMGARLDSSLLTQLNTLYSRFDPPPGGQYSGWYMYFDRDIRALLNKKKKRLPDQFSLSYCGRGNLARCRQDVWSAIEAAGQKLTADQGTSNPGAWRASATKEQIHFSPIPLITMAYTNRPSGIQQVISFGR